MVTLKTNTSVVKIDAGELVGYEVKGHEFIHQKGSPGWGSADTEMFPIIGPVNESDFRVKTPKGEAIQDQHGLLRQMAYELGHQTDTSAVFVKQYRSGTEVPNSKFPEKSTEALLSWPYDFRFEKSFLLTDDGLEIHFKIYGEKGMPFMLGYHPAFKLHSKSPMIVTEDKAIALDEVLEAGSRAFQVEDCTSITLKDEKQITIETEGFGNFMCWTEVRNMVCIEPISFYPSAVNQTRLHKGFQKLEETAEFKVILKPEA
ncbi:aldose 1-epimerase [Flagellimonas halotolerans]|uniref:Aldose 1-epimerase n=1 Tax=Flagellimonas halotolerans TaxID=3112164 RepID=A0ABU6IQ09_9FLAO|nr:MULTISPECIES: aldose 1-epimerase [unclassified Allomuricauda]MEC3965329.1 aldose 1-epimerase [Muricauda sp. SYSU M86414]MEC4265195.1 aldose 1-epimerase [Muricauda sp. SYSU M84420]